MYKLIARPKPYKTYINLFTKDTVAESENLKELEDKCDQLLKEGRYWIIEILQLTPSGKMVAVEKYFPI